MFETRFDITIDLLEDVSCEYPVDTENGILISRHPSRRVRRLMRP